MAEVAEPVLKSDAELHLLLQRTKAWVFFWARGYDHLKALLANVPGIDDKKGEASYRERLLYMDRQHLEQFVQDLELQPNRDYFSDSLLGRAYARVASLKTDVNERKNLFQTAREYLEKTCRTDERERDSSSESFADFVNSAGPHGPPVRKVLSTTFVFSTLACALR